MRDKFRVRAIIVISAVAAFFGLLTASPALAIHGGACAHQNGDGSIQCAGSNVFCGGTCVASEPTCSAPRTVINCGSCGCSCPSATPNYCSSADTCVATISCSGGQTFDPCANGGAGGCVGNAYVVLSPATPQSGNVSITGSLRGGSLSVTGDASAGGDVYIGTGKAIRVDAASASRLNIGNWGGGALAHVNIWGGGLSLYNDDLPQSNTIETAKLCLGNSTTGVEAFCRTDWPSGITGSGTVGRVPRFATSSSIGDSAALYATGIGLSIGTASANAPLTFGATTGVAAYLNPVGGSLYIGTLDQRSFEISSANGMGINSMANIFFNIDSDNGEADIRYIDFRKNGVGAAGGTSLMRLTEAGDLGIGTSAPTAGARLDVDGQAKMNAFRLGTAATPGYVLTADGSGVGTWQAVSTPVSSVSGSGAGISVSPTTGAVVVSNTGVTSLAAGTGITLSGSTGAVTVTNAGITGSGTLNNVPKFTGTSSLGNSRVIDDGSGPVTVTSGTLGTSALRGVSTASNGTGVSGDGAYAGAQFTSSAGYGVYGNGPTYGVYGAGSNVGVYGNAGTGLGGYGTSYGLTASSPWVGAYIESGATSAYIAHGGAGYSFNGTGYFQNSGSANITGTLQMSGFRLGTSATAGRVLTADASGNGTWQALPAPPVTSVSGSGAGISVTPTTGAVVVSNTDTLQTVTSRGNSASNSYIAASFTGTAYGSTLYAPYYDYGLYASGPTMGGYFYDTNNTPATSAYIAYSGYSFYGYGALYTTGNIQAGGDLYLGTRGAWLSGWLNQPVLTTSWPTFGSVYSNNWFRSNGATGWYNETYGGGMWMNDSTWVETYNGKNLWASGNLVAAQGSGNYQPYIGDDGWGSDVQVGSLNSGISALAAYNWGGNFRMNMYAAAYYTASSKRWKKDIRTIDNALEMVKDLRGVYYNWKEGTIGDTPDSRGKTQVGMIAEEVGEVVPEIVKFEEDGSGYAVDMSYERLGPILIEAVKEQQKIIESLEARIKALESGTR